MIKPKSESAIERKCMLLAKSLGWFEVKLEKCNKNGMPDRMLIRNGVVLFVEFKNDNGVLSEIQKFRIEELRGHKMKVYVIRSEIAFKVMLDEYEL